MQNNNNQKQTVSLDANTMGTLVNMMRTMIRQEISSSKPAQQNNQPKGAVSIRDEIRNIVRQELASMKNQNNKPVQNKPNQPKFVPQNRMVQNIQKPVQQNKPIQQNNQKQVSQNKPNQPQGNIVRITSIEQLKENLQKIISAQIAKKQEMVRSVQNNQPKQVQQQRPAQNKQVLQTKQMNVQVKVVQQNKPVQNKQVQQQRPAPQNNQQKPQVQNGEQKKRPNVPNPQQQKVLATQANDLLSKIGSAKKPVQNSQQKK